MYNHQANIRLRSSIANNSAFSRKKRKNLAYAYEVSFLLALL